MSLICRWYFSLFTLHILNLLLDSMFIIRLHFFYCWVWFSLSFSTFLSFSVFSSFPVFLFFFSSISSGFFCLLSFFLSFSHCFLSLTFFVVIFSVIFSFSVFLFLPFPEFLILFLHSSAFNFIWLSFSYLTSFSPIHSVLLSLCFFFAFLCFFLPLLFSFFLSLFFFLLSVLSVLFLFYLSWMNESYMNPINTSI